MGNIDTKKLLIYGAIGIGGIIAFTFIARRLGGKPYGIWIYR
jgi:hypothetical protein